MKFSLGGLKQSELVGIAGAVVLEPTLDALVDRFVPIANPYDDIVAVIAMSYLLGKKKKGAIGGFVKAFATIKTAKIIKSLMSGGFSLLSATTTQSATNNLDVG